ncbi:hypothetical protein [Cedecea sp. NFIX57]|uniref:hypothetical protein n=1 Tax=Cedecea sp. NFIX57 TaxID=1566286 RepID=UPI000A0C84AF|nr:hypothetical protein [Cedecea sp. NFIX57]SMG61922.1 hypothetical protein SAMN03159353_10793 [Cedecea sp. NFIX57]
MNLQPGSQPLLRGLKVTAALGFVLLVILAPFLFWTLLFTLWNCWAAYAGWNVMIPVGWKSVVSAVVICWFLRWVIGRRSA